MFASTLLSFFRGKDNVIEVKACVREKDHVVIVMPYFPHEKFQVSFSDTSLHFTLTVYIFSSRMYLLMKNLTPSKLNYLIDTKLAKT